MPLAAAGSAVIGGLCRGQESRVLSSSTPFFVHGDAVGIGLSPRDLDKRTRPKAIAPLVFSAGAKAISLSLCLIFF